MGIRYKKNVIYIVRSQKEYLLRFRENNAINQNKAWGLTDSFRLFSWKLIEANDIHPFELNRF